METRDWTLWLYRGHGRQVSDLKPLPALRRGGATPAKALAAEIRAADGIESLRGVPCTLAGTELQTATGEEDCVLTRLFLTELSYARLPACGTPDVAVVAVVLPREEGSIRGTSVGGDDMAGTHAWFIITEGREAHLDLVDALSRVGALRDDLEQAFTPSTDEDGGIIGEGAYATVYCMRDREGQATAVKKMNAQVELESIQREVAMLLEVQRHDHVIGFKGLFWRREAEAVRFCVAFEVAPCGDLLYKVLKHGAMTEAAARPLFAGIMQGLAHIHAHDIVHRDIKAENILLKGDDHPVVADFGLATWLSDEVQMARRCGSPGYVAPEVCLGTPYSLKVDVFGAGIVLYLMLSKEMPFSSADRDTAATMRRTVKCSLHLHRPPWEKMSSRLRNVLRLMICKNPDERLSAAGTLEHPWLTSTKDRSERSRVVEPEEAGVQD